VVWILGGNNDPNSVDDKNLSPGERWNLEFESTIGRNTNGITGENENIASLPTHSCVVDNGKLLANLYIIVTD
jgi:hypothetical protein